MSIIPQNQKPYGVVYTVTNRATGKQYVGQTTQDVDERWRQHTKEALRGRKGCRLLYGAIRKYGQSAFEIEAVIACDTQEELDRIEQMAIVAGNTLAPNGYNLRDGGMGGKHSAKSRAKMSAAHMGKLLSPETRARLSEALKGIPHSKEARNKMIEAQRGRVFSLEHRSRISTAKTGKKLSPEHRARISAGLRGKKRKPFSSDHRARLSAAAKSRWLRRAT